MSPPGLKSYRWIILLVLSSSYASVIGLFFAIPPLAPFLQADLGISRAQVGLLMAVNLVGAAVATTPGGWLADRSIRWNLLSCQALIAATLLFFSRAATPEQALLAALGFGLGKGGLLPAMTKAITLWFPFKERATAMGLFFSGPAVGSAAGALLLPSLSLSVGWRQALLIVAMVILGLGIASIVLYRDRGAAPELLATAVARGADRTKPAGLSYRNISVLGLVAILLGAPQYAFATYLPLYLKEVLYFPVVQAGLFLAVVQGSSVLGRIGWGIVSDRVLGGNRKAVFLILGSIFTLCLPLVAGGLSSQTALLLLMFIVGISGFAWFNIWMTLLAETSGAESAVAMGYGQTLSYMGVIAGPPLFGYLVDASDSYTPAWIASTVVAGIATVLIGLVREARRPAASAARGPAQASVAHEG